MPSEKPILVVCGATGNQGGSVISFYLSQPDSPYTIRGVTRNPSSEKSLELISKGVEMVAGNFDEPASLDAAFVGASVIFATSDFWAFFINPENRKKAEEAGQNIGVLSRENDEKLNKNVIDAAAKVTTLKRFIYSTQANTRKLSEGKIDKCYHFDGKALAEEYGKATYPELWAKTNVIHIVFYFENYLGPMGPLLRPRQSQEKEDTLVLYMAEPFASAVLPWLSVNNDAGPLVDGLIRSSAGHKVVAVNEYLSMKDMAQAFADALGKKLEVVDENPDFDLGDPVRTEDNMAMMQFCVEYGFDGSVVDKSVVKPSDIELGVSLKSVREWAKSVDWTGLVDADNKAPPSLSS